MQVEYIKAVVARDKIVSESRVRQLLSAAHARLDCGRGNVFGSAATEADVEALPPTIPGQCIGRLLRSWLVSIDTAGWLNC